HAMHHDGFVLDSVENAKREPGDEYPPKDTPLLWTALGMQLDASDRSVHTLNEVHCRSGCSGLIPAGRGNNVLLGLAPNDEREAHRNSRISRSRTSDHGDPSEGF